MKPVDRYTCDGPRRIDDDLLDDITQEIKGVLYRNVFIMGYPPDIAYRWYDFAAEIKRLRETCRKAIDYLETEDDTDGHAANLLREVLEDD